MKDSRNSVRNEFERFFRSNSKVSIYKPLFLKSLLDLGDFKEKEGSQWIKDNGDSLIVDLEFIAVRFIYFCYPLYYKFRLKPQFGIKSILSYKIFEEFNVFPIKSKSNVTKVEFSKNKYIDARSRLIKDGISKTVFNLLLKDCNIYSKIDSYTFEISKENVRYLLEHKHQLTKALNHELSLFLGTINNSPNIPAKLQEKQRRSKIDPSISLENIKLANFRCFYCEKQFKKFHQDHFIPWNFVYTDEKHNLVPACEKCNCSKNDKLASKEFLEKIIKRNQNLKMSDGYSESSMRNEWENCRLYYHGENEPLWQHA